VNHKNGGSAQHEQPGSFTSPLLENIRSYLKLNEGSIPGGSSGLSKPLAAAEDFEKTGGIHFFEQLRAAL